MHRLIDDAAPVVTVKRDAACVYHCSVGSLAVGEGGEEGNRQLKVQKLTGNMDACVVEDDAVGSLPRHTTLVFPPFTEPDGKYQPQCIIIHAARLSHSRVIVTNANYTVRVMTQTLAAS